MTKEKSALLAILASIFLVVLKLSVGIAANSVSIISDAMHSFMDVLASTMTFFAIRFAQKPPDKCHNFGHGKIEDLAAVIQSILILMVSVTIIRQAYIRIVEQNYITDTTLGIVVMLVSIAIHGLVVWNMLTVAKKENSIALRANGLHLLTDIITSVGVVIGLVFIHFTGLKILDPIIAMVVALIIIKTGFSIGRDSLKSLLDSSLSEKDIQKVKDIIEKYSPPIMEYHKLRTRKMGGDKQMDVHIVLPKDMNIKEAHDLSIDVQSEIEKSFRDAKVVIHLEPKE
ncbi:cation diffusion facilitator family transporter [Proteinivorax hydrogeniformans]|uniref:Cation diffusion facilitator family transporter n=1 Tax=Proteinivorax hydrogeniformans TaxID=1826727 RepID=A0AAU8HS18_9FIRM